MAKHTPLDAERARKARDEAMATVEANIASEWNETADMIIGLLAAAGRPFTSDDVWSAGLVKPREPRALGPRFMVARNVGLITRTGVWRPTRQVLRHACPVAEWVGLGEPCAEAARTLAYAVLATAECGDAIRGPE